MKYAKVIAIDGPSGSGKSTVAKKLSTDLNLLYLDTGAMFRALAVALSKLEIDYSQNELSQDDVTAMDQLLASLKFEYAPTDDILVRVNGEDLTLKIREHEVSALSSQVSKFENVREYLKKIQRDLALVSTSVLDGRDIGTVIFPNAAIKIFINASSDIRATRRLAEIQERDTSSSETFESIKHDIEERDKQDTQREIAPLKKADDAIEIDSTHWTIQEVVSQVEELFLKNKERFI